MDQPSALVLGNWDLVINPAMSIKFRCPNGHLLQARDDKAGKKMRCPACKEIVTVPMSPARGDSSASKKQPKKKEPDDTTPRPIESKSPEQPRSSKPSKKKKPAKRPAPPSTEKKQQHKPAAAAKAKPADKEPTKKQSKKEPSQQSPKPPPLPKAATAHPSEEKPGGPPALKEHGRKQSHTDPPANRHAEKQKKSKSKQGKSKRTEQRQTKTRKEPTVTKTTPRTGATTTVGDTSPPSISEAWSVAAPPVQTGIRKWLGCREASSGYRADVGKVTTVRWLALFLAVVAILGAIPALLDRNHFYVWSHAILFISALQLLYVFWMFTMPDWSTVWVLMLVFAVTAALYGFGLALTFLMPMQSAMPFELQPVRDSAPIWCAVMLLFTFLGAFLCGRYSFRWYRAYVLAARGE
jgi:hypothetical protein